MARIRTVKPEFWKNEKLSALPEATHLLAGALLCYADDEGFFNANPALVKAECSPLREPSVSIPESLETLFRIGYIDLGNGPDGRRYGRIVEFATHQRVNRPTPSKIKELQVSWEGSGKPHGLFSESSLPEQGTGKGTGNREQGREWKESPNGDSRGAAAPPADLVLRKEERLQQVTTDAVEAYNAILARPHGLLPKVVLVNDTRRAEVKRCIKTAREICERSYGSGTITAEFWRGYFTDCAADDFFAGRSKPRPGHENWRPDFEFLTKPKTMTKVFEKALSEVAA